MGHDSDRGGWRREEPENRANKVFTEQQRLDKETLDVLAGRRISERKRSAVRIVELTGILQMPQKIQAVKLTAAPTMDQYNTLLADVTKLHAQLLQVSAALQGRLTPPLPKTPVVTVPVVP